MSSLTNNTTALQGLLEQVNALPDATGGGTYMNYDLNVKAINHRGYSVEAPENTIPAYIMSKRKGFTYVECDVSFTSDGVAVLLHDATIDRTSDGTGNISSVTYEQALQYDFGSWFSSDYTGVKIPTFTEFIVLCKRLGLHPYIELKSNGSYTQSQITQIVNEVKECGMAGKVTYISFSNTFLGYVKNADASARLGLLANPLTSTKISQAVALRSGTNEVFMDAKLSTVTTTLLNSCIDKGLPLEVWTVNTEKEILSMPNYVSGVTSDSLIAGKVLYEAALTYVPPESTYVPATGITLDKSAITFSQFESQTLVATVEPVDASDVVAWKSSATSIATVEDGVVTPVANGTCTITATAGSYSATCSVTVDVVMYSITRNLTGCKTSSDVTSVENNKSHTETFTVLAGYKMDGATISVLMGGNDITSNYVDGVLTIDAVTGDVVITITAVEVPTYSITRNLTGCTSSSTELKVNEGGALTETITALANYTLEGATVVVTMGGADVSSAYDSATGIISITEVTGDVVITITAADAPVYTITRNLTNCESSSTVTSIRGGNSHTETITASENRYTLDGAVMSVTMGGNDITSSCVDGVITIESVTGDIIINIAAVAAGPVVDLTLANVTNGVLTNNGSGGSTYDATVTNGEYTSDADGLTLLTTAYTSVPYGFKATDKFTILVRGSFDEVNTQNYQRLMRTNQDMPSIFYRKSDTCVCVKLAGKSGNGYAMHDDIGTWSSSSNCLSMLIDTIGLGVQHAYAWVGNGSKIYFYVDGVLTASQNSSPMTASTSIGIGNNDKSSTYYANKLTVSAFKIYNYALTAEEVAGLV